MIYFCIKYKSKKQKYSEIRNIEIVPPNLLLYVPKKNVDTLGVEKFLLSSKLCGTVSMQSKI